MCSALVSLLQLPKLKSVDETKKAIYFKQEKSEETAINFLDNLPSLGFGNLISDWIMLKFVQYFGDDVAREETGYSLSPDYLEAIVQHDPRFTQAYLIISPASSLFAGRPERTVALMEQGLDQLSPAIPKAYFIWLYKGVDEILFLADTKAAQKSYTMAAKWAKLAGDTEIEEAARNTAQFLAKNPDSKVARIGAWTMVLSSATDAKTQQRAINEIKALGGEIITTPEGRLSVKVPDDG